MSGTTTVDEQRDLVAQTRESFEARLNELREEIAPKQKEMTELERVLSAMRGSRTRSTGGSSTGRPRGRKPQRQMEFVSVVESNPGIIVSEAARIMGIKQNYLYRVANKALEDGLVSKDDDGGYRLATDSATIPPTDPDLHDEGGAEGDDE